MSIPVIDLKGSAHEIGLQHGQALAQSIQQCLALYEQVIGTPFTELKDRAEIIESQLQVFAPELVTEVHGIAEGAGVEAYKLMLLNARSELMSSADGCTALFKPEAKLLAQTWDWMEAMQALVVVLRIEHEDGRKILTVSEPGMVGKIGFNTSGVGCTLNFLFSPGVHEGTPVHMLLRSILESDSLEGALERIENRLPGQSGNLMIGSLDGGRNVELAGKTYSVSKISSQAFAHTNHHLETDIPAGDLTENSHTRCNRASQFLQDNTTPALDLAKQILSDQTDSEFPICATYKPLLGTLMGTVCTVIMELDKQQMHVRLGADPAAAFTQIGWT